VDNVAAVELTCGQVRRCVEDRQGGSDNLRKRPPHRRRGDEGISTGLHL